jgi:hypothetical protein
VQTHFTEQVSVVIDAGLIKPINGVVHRRDAGMVGNSACPTRAIRSGWCIVSGAGQSITRGYP